MSRKFSVLFCICLMSQVVHSNAIDTFKGIWSTVENFPVFKSSFWTGLARNFGAPPAGYRYSFDVYNDMQQPVWVGVSEIMSFMGADFPKADGWSVEQIPSVVQAPLNHYKVMDKEYYFELLIKSTNSNYSSYMPYQSHDDVLYRQEVIELNEKNSTHLNYFRAFMGKELQNGAYIHMPKAEYLGYKNYSPVTTKQDSGDVVLDATLQSLVLYNSADVDYYVGYINQAHAATMTKQSCQVFALVQANSFAVLNTFDTLTSLTPGSIGLFDVTSNNLLITYSLPVSIFKNMPYTLEIYKDVGKSVQMDLQGLMPGNYDQPIGRVRDITPVTCVFWYQAAQQFAKKSGYVDLPGKVYVIEMSDTPSVLAGAVAGDAVQFSVMRPEIDKKSWIYFVYLPTQDAKKSQQFLDSFMHGTIADSTLQMYHQQAQVQMKFVQQQTMESATVEKNMVSKKKDVVPQSVLTAAAQGALQLHGGMIQDQLSGVSGYLLGADVFLPHGVGMQPMYYVLQPSQKNSAQLNVPQSTVQNLFIQTLSTQSPKGMPAPEVIAA